MRRLSRSTVLCTLHYNNIYFIYYYHLNGWTASCVDHIPNTHTHTLFNHTNMRTQEKKQNKIIKRLLTQACNLERVMNWKTGIEQQQPQRQQKCNKYKCEKKNVEGSSSPLYNCGHPKPQPLGWHSVRLIETFFFRWNTVFHSWCWTHICIWVHNNNFFVSFDGVFSTPSIHFIEEKKYCAINVRLLSARVCVCS